MEEKEHSEHDDRKAQEVEETGEPKIPEDAVEDLEAPEEEAAEVKGGKASPKLA